MGATESCPRLIQTLGLGALGGSHPAGANVAGIAYRIDALLGEGGYAFVYRASPAAGGGAAVALKRFVCGGADDVRRAVAECELQRRLSPHAGVPRYVGHSTPEGGGAADGGEVWLAMELASGGALRAVVDQRVAFRSRHPHYIPAAHAPGATTIAMPSDSPAAAPAAQEPLMTGDSGGVGGAEGHPLFTAAEVLVVLSDIVAAVAHCHAQRPAVAHWDVKLENIVLADGRYKLCDLGSATTDFFPGLPQPQGGGAQPAGGAPAAQGQAHGVAQAQARMDAVLTAQYKAPEACDLWQGLPCGPAMDVWALGVCAFTMLAGQMPFPDGNQRRVLGMQLEPGAVPEAFAALVHPPLDPAAPAAAPLPPAELLRLGTAPGGAAAGRPGALALLWRLVLGGLLDPDPRRRPDIFTVSAALHEIYPSHRCIVRPA